MATVEHVVYHAMQRVVSTVLQRLREERAIREPQEIRGSIKLSASHRMAI